MDFLPGVAHCSLGGSHDYTGDWERLKCIATVGSMLGQIQCYQGGNENALFKMNPLKTITLWNRPYWYRQNRHHVYCCSSQLIEPKERCDCNDTVWDSLSQAVVHNPGDPCPTTTTCALRSPNHLLSS